MSYAMHPYVQFEYSNRSKYYSVYIYSNTGSLLVLVLTTCTTAVYSCTPTEPILYILIALLTPQSREGRTVLIRSVRLRGRSRFTCGARKLLSLEPA